METFLSVALNLGSDWRKGFGEKVLEKIFENRDRQQIDRKTKIIFAHK